MTDKQQDDLAAAKGIFGWAIIMFFVWFLAWLIWLGVTS